MAPETQYRNVNVHYVELLFFSFMMAVLLIKDTFIKKIHLVSY